MIIYPFHSRLLLVPPTSGKEDHHALPKRYPKLKLKSVDTQPWEMQAKHHEYKETKEIQLHQSSVKLSLNSI